MSEIRGVRTKEGFKCAKCRAVFPERSEYDLHLQWHRNLRILLQELAHGSTEGFEQSLERFV